MGDEHFSHNLLRACIELNIQQLSVTVEVLKSFLQFLQIYPFPYSAFNVSAQDMTQLIREVREENMASLFEGGRPFQRTSARNQTVSPGFTTFQRNSNITSPPYSGISNSTSSHRPNSSQRVPPGFTPRYQSNSIFNPPHYQGTSNIPTSSQRISPPSSPPSQSIPNIPSPDYESISNLPTSLGDIWSPFTPSTRSISNTLESLHQDILNMPTSLGESFTAPAAPCHQSTAIPRSHPLPFRTENVTFSEESRPGPSTSRCNPIQNLSRTIVSSCSTHGLSDNQACINGLAIRLAEAQLEQPKIKERVSQAEDPETQLEQPIIKERTREKLLKAEEAKAQLEQPNIKERISQKLVETQTAKVQLEQPNITERISRQLKEAEEAETQSEQPKITEKISQEHVEREEAAAQPDQPNNKERISQDLSEAEVAEAQPEQPNITEKISQESVEANEAQAQPEQLNIKERISQEPVEANEAQAQPEQPNIKERTSQAEETEAQLEQPNINERSQELLEAEEISSLVAMGSSDKGKDHTDVRVLEAIPDASSTWSWKRWVATPAIKHKRNAITAMCYVPTFERPSYNFDDSSGWLISSSEKNLNLWQCTTRSSVSQPFLQNKSFEGTEFIMEDMVVDMEAKFCCAICPCLQEKALCITMHSLGGPAFFKYEGMIRIPFEDKSLCTKQSSYKLRNLHLASLQPMGGTFGNSIAAAYYTDIHVYDLSSVSASPSKVVPLKPLWQVNGSYTSCMLFNSFICSLITGSSDGYIQLWDIKTKPCNPITRYHQKDPITCLEMLDETTMCSGSLDGTFQLHDIRFNALPFLSSIIPNEKPILHMASNPMNSTVAFTTIDELFCLEGKNSNSRVDDATTRNLTSGYSLWSIMSLPSNELSTGIKWNTRTCTEIYASQSDGSIAIFAKVDADLYGMNG